MDDSLAHWDLAHLAIVKTLSANAMAEDLAAQIVASARIADELI